MKSPMRYQMTEFDCGPTTFTNGIAYLFARKEIPCEIVKGIYHYTLDMINGAGKSTGTSRAATKLLTRWLNEFSKKQNFPLRCERFSGKNINSEFLTNKINNSVIVLRLWLECEHYVLVTAIKQDKVYLFDPYYGVEKDRKEDDVEIVLESKLTYNRIVSLKRLDSLNKKEYYAMGQEKTRECIVLRREEYGKNKHGKNG